MESQASGDPKVLPEALTSQLVPLGLPPSVLGASMAPAQDSHTLVFGVPVNGNFTSIEKNLASELGVVIMTL